MRARMLTAAVVVQGVLLFTGTGASASSACPGDEQVPTAATAADAAAALVCDINAIRAHNGLGPVRPDDRLAEPAQDLASDMAAHHFVSHISSDGRTLLDRLGSTGYMDATTALALENVDFGTSVYATPLATAFGWMNSDEHRANLLDPQIEDVGVGVATGQASDNGATGVFYVADFGTRRSDDNATASTTTASTTTRARACSARKHYKHRVRHKRTRRCRA